MILYKNLQITNLKPYQAKNSINYLLLSSINSHSLYSSNKTTSRFFSNRFFNLNFRKIFNFEKISPNTKKKFIKTSTCLATFTKSNQPSFEQPLKPNKTDIDLKYVSEIYSNLSLFLKNLKTNSKIKYQAYQSKFFQNYTKNDFDFFNEKKAKFSDKLHLLIKKFHKKFNSFKFNFELFNKKYFFTLSATGGLFTWDEYKITNEEIKNEVNEILTLFDLNNKENESQKRKVKIDFEASRKLENSEWKLIYDKRDLLIWRRSFVLDEVDDEENKSSNEPVNYDLFEYKVLGRFNDITPLEFYQTQTNLEYRKEWDYLVIELVAMDKDSSSNTELVKWIMRFPYPLYPREYIYVRRYCIDPTENLLLLVSRSLPKVKFELNKQSEIEPKQTEEHNHGHKTTIVNKHHNTFHNQSANQLVRVTQYKSNIIIIPHSDFDKPGFDYVIQYYDVNKAKIPKLAYKWMATSGLPDFIDKLHKATIKLKHRHEKENVRNEDLLAKYEILYLNKPEEVVKLDDVQVKTKPEEVSSDQNEKLRQEKEDCEKVVENIIKQIENYETNESSKAPLNVNIVKLNEIANLSEEYLRAHNLIFIVETMYNNFFEYYEPHPIFYNF